MKAAIGIVVLAALVGGAYFLNDLTRDEDGRSLLHVAKELEVLVETAKPERGKIIRWVQAPGEVEAFEEVDISSEVMGKILEMTVEEGDPVQAGELLCRLDDADFRAQVESGEATVEKLKALITQSKADLELAERDWSEAQRLRERGAIAETDVANYRTRLIKTRAAVEMSEQELKEAQARLASAREYLAKTVIRAPLSGVVSQLFAEQGEVVVTGTMNNPGTRILVVSDLSKMQVRCRVDEADAPLVKPDQPARIYLQSDTRRSVPGRVLRVGTKGTKPLGRDVVTFETLVLITGDDPRVKPGMSANVEIEVARNDEALTMPVEAVVYRKRRDLPEELCQQFDAQRGEHADLAEEQRVAEYLKIVFCIEDGKARPRLVQTGINDATKVEVLAGLAEESVIVTGPYRSLDQLKDGSPVKLKEDERPAGSDAATTQPAAAESQPAEMDEPDTGAADTTP